VDDERAELLAEEERAVLGLADGLDVEVAAGEDALGRALVASAGRIARASSLVPSPRSRAEATAGMRAAASTEAPVMSRFMPGRASGSAGAAVNGG
jgi:hypothetical protein